MKRLFVLVLIIALSGCSVKQSPTFECISDSAVTPAVPTYYIDAAVPQQAVLTASCNNGCCAVFSHDDFEIYQEIFEADSPDDACQKLTGRNLAALSPIRIQTFPYEEYRYSYQAAGENGVLSCMGKFCYDGKFCYAVTALCSTEKAPFYHEDFTQLLSCTEIKAV